MTIKYTSKATTACIKSRKTVGLSLWQKLGLHDVALVHLHQTFDKCRQRSDAETVICCAKRKKLKKTVKRIQEKIMRATSTLDWSQSKIFFCYFIHFIFLVYELD